jgi:hypothetical protein
MARLRPPTIKQHGHGGSRFVQPVTPDKAGMNTLLKKSTFYWSGPNGQKNRSALTGGRIEWNPPLRSIAQAMGGLEEYTMVAAMKEMAEVRTAIEEDLRAKTYARRKWVDRSEAARDSLYAEISRSANRVQLRIGYEAEALLAFQYPARNRNYSVFLETMQDGVFAVIEPTIEHYSVGFMNTFVDMWHRNESLMRGPRMSDLQRAQQLFGRINLADLNRRNRIQRGG